MPTSKQKTKANLRSCVNSSRPGHSAWRLSPIAIGVACALAGKATPVVAQSGGGIEIEEIIVTATRRDESTIDVPYNISAYSSDTLESSRILDMASVSRMVVGLQAIDSGPSNHNGENRFIIRGLNTDFDTGRRTFPNLSVAPVATYFGETPLFYSMTLDDIERVEVLRGPQGTLYGSGSLGGTIRFIPKAPDLESFDAAFGATTSLTKDGDDPGYAFDGMINIPLSDSAALRLVGGYDEMAGFIDAKGLVAVDANGTSIPSDPLNPSSGFTLQPEQEDVNETTRWHLRASLLVNINDDWTVTAGYHHEEHDVGDTQVSNSGWEGGRFDPSDTTVPGVPHQNDFGCPGGCWGPSAAAIYPSVGRNEHLLTTLSPVTSDLDVFSLTVEANLGFAALTSSTSYFEQGWDADWASNYNHFGPGRPSFSYFYGYFPRFYIPNSQSLDSEGFAQEVRFVSSWEKPWDFVVGGFYQKGERDQFTTQHYGSPYRQWAAVAIAYAFPNPEWGDQAWDYRNSFEAEDTAVFGELTWRVSDRWQITGGVRQFWTDFSNTTVQLLPFCGAACSSTGTDPLGEIVGGGEDKDDGQVFRLNTSYELSDDMLAYFNVAQGYRRGGANALSLAGFWASLPEYESYDSDQATNWELGLKGSLAGVANYSAAAFFIQWDDVQVEGSAPTGLPYTVNFDKAESRGAEIEINGVIAGQFTYRFGYAYTDAEIAEDVTLRDLAIAGLASDPPAIIDNIQVTDGDRLPAISKHQLVLSADYEVSLNPGRSLRFHVNGSYRSNFVTLASAATPAETFSGFWRWDASAVLLSDKGWTARLFIENLSNVEGTTGGTKESFFGSQGTALFVMRPRTIGLDLKWELATGS